MKLKELGRRLEIQKHRPTQRASDGWYAPRFWLLSELEEVPNSELLSHQPPVKLAVGRE